MFDLLPISYLFRSGHSVRVAIAGADKDHFALLKTDSPPTLEFQRSRAYASAVDLPVTPDKVRTFLRGPHIHLWGKGFGMMT